MGRVKIMSYVKLKTDSNQSMIMKKLNLISLLLILGSLQISCQDTQPEADFAFRNVSVLPMETENIRENQTVLVKGEQILKIGPADDMDIPPSATVIDGTGKLLIPGLAEMHAHIPGLNNGEEYVEEVLFLFLANGVTTIRGMLGQPYHLELREKVKNNEILGPRIYTSGPSLNGNSVQSVEQAREKVTAQKEAGYDFLKLHPGLRLEVFNEIVRTANEVGIPYAGHVSVDVGIRRAIESGYGSIDHVDGYLEGLVPESAGVDPSQNGFFGINFTDLADTTMIEELVEATREANVWVVSTQSLMERWAGPLSPEDMASQPEMKYISENQLGAWVFQKRQFLSSDSYSQERANKFNTIRRQIIRKLHEGGAGMLLGSDAPQVSNVPGFSIHHELDEMIRAGLSPFESLATGTVNPAAYFGDSTYGMIKEGMIADLILVDAGLLEDISKLRENSGVMVRGKWLSPQEIGEKLSEIAARYSD